MSVGQRFGRGLALPLLAAVMGALFVGAPAQAAPSATQLTSAEIALLNSTEEKTVAIDAKTGAVLSVTPGSPIRSLISMNNPCQFSDVCWYGSAVPYANLGWFGSNGTSTGNWPNRQNGNTGGYWAKLCWSGGCTPDLTPQTAVTLTGPVTGISVKISGRVS